MRPPFSILDRYLLVNIGATFVSVFGIVVSLMLFEHVPRLFELARLSGRKAYLVIESMIALLPEYAGLGLLFGLYLSIALTVRRLSLRGELDVIEASGVKTLRWMRFPALVGVLVSLLLAWTQGWLMPAGERRLNDLGQQMQDGSFGYDLEARRFIDVSKNVTLRFDRVDPTSGDLQNVFVRSGETTFTARRGRLGFDFGGHFLVDLQDGRSIDGDTGRSVLFSRFHFDNGAPEEAPAATPNRFARRKLRPLPELLKSRQWEDRAAAWSRLMWPGFALLVPSIAGVLGKPARRQSGTLGLMAGLILLVLFIRTAGLVERSHLPPSIAAGLVALGWTGTSVLLVRGERRWNAGYVDDVLRRAAERAWKPRHQPALAV